MIPKNVAVLAVLVSTGSLLAASCGSTTSTTTVVAKSTTTTAATVYTYPLTGQVAPSQAATQVPALEIKIDNAPQVAWPQAGLNQADDIYEEVVEGGYTRYMAIFQSQNAPVVGPVRSVRYSDALIVAPIGGLFGYSGGIPPFVSAVQAAGIYDVGVNSAAGGDYYRDNSRAAPHNLFTSTTSLRASAGSNGSPAPQIFQYLSTKHTNTKAGGQGVSSVEVEMSGAVYALWNWNAGTSTWARTTNGTPQVDTSGAPLVANNVIIEEVPYPNTQYIDPAGNPVPYANSVGTGVAYYMVDGQYFSGTWSKPQPSSITKFSDASGKPIYLSPGRTWVMLAPTGASITPTFTTPPTTASVAGGTSTGSSSG